MKTSKWLDRWRAVLLGAIGGLFSSAIYLMAYRAEEYLAELDYQKQLALDALNPNGVTICRMSILNPLWWVDASIWHIILFVVASLLVHRYFSKRMNSVFLLWQSIGLMVIVGWGLTVLFGIILDGYLAKGVFPLDKIFEGIISTSNQRSAFKFVALILGINVIYGTLMQLAAKHYRAVEAE